MVVARFWRPKRKSNSLLLSGISPLDKPEGTATSQPARQTAMISPGLTWPALASPGRASPASSGRLSSPGRSVHPDGLG